MLGGKSNHRKYIWIELGLLLFLGISQYFGVSGINLGIVLLLICLFAALPGNMQAEALFIAMPFFNLFSYKMGTTSMFYFLIIIYICRYLRRRHFRIKREKLAVFLVCCIFTISIRNAEVWLKWVLRFGLMVLLFNDKDMNHGLEETAKYTSVSAIISSMVGYLMLVNDRSIYNRSYVYIEGVGSNTRFAGLIGDSVFYGQFIAVLIAVNLLFAYQDPKYKRFTYVSSAIMTAFALLSISKTAIILIVIEVTAYVLLLIARNSKSRKTVIWSVILVFGAFCAIVLLYWYVMTHTDNILIQGFLTRFASGDLWTGRTSIARTYLEWLGEDWRYWLSGMSYGQYTQGIKNGSLLITRAHNIFIESACVFGVIPSIVIIMSLVVYFCRQHARHHTPVIAYLPLAVLIASGLALHGHYEWHYYFLCSMSFACIHSSVGEKKERLPDAIYAIS